MKIWSNLGVLFRHKHSSRHCDNFYTVTVHSAFQMDIMKAMHQYCIHEFEKECFTKYERELRYMALGQLGTLHICINVFGLRTRIRLLFGVTEFTEYIHTASCRHNRRARSQLWKHLLHWRRVSFGTRKVRIRWKWSVVGIATTLPSLICGKNKEIVFT